MDKAKAEDESFLSFLFLEGTICRSAPCYK